MAYNVLFLHWFCHFWCFVHEILQHAEADGSLGHFSQSPKVGSISDGVTGWDRAVVPLRISLTAIHVSQSYKIIFPYCQQTSISCPCSVALNINKQVSPVPVQSHLTSTNKYLLSLFSAIGAQDKCCEKFHVNLVLYHFDRKTK